MSLILFYFFMESAYMYKLQSYPSGVLTNVAFLAPEDEYLCFWNDLSFTLTHTQSCLCQELMIGGNAWTLRYRPASVACYGLTHAQVKRKPNHEKAPHCSAFTMVTMRAEWHSQLRAKKLISIIVQILLTT